MVGVTKRYGDLNVTYNNGDGGIYGWKFTDANGKSIARCTAENQKADIETSYMMKFNTVGTWYMKAGVTFSYNMIIPS